MTDIIFTIGHSTHSAAHFVGLLKRNAVTAVADVRSHPYSRRNPQFRKHELERTLAGHGIAYVFLGKELGARTDNPECYVNGRVEYRLLAAEPLFRQGVKRLLAGTKHYTVAMMCAERDPLQCHRTLLICREIRTTVKRIGHILADSSVETNADAEARLVRMHGLVPDMLTTEQECIEKAYDLQAARTAYVDENITPRSG